MSIQSCFSSLLTEPESCQTTAQLIATQTQPETQLLLCCAQARLDLASIARIQSLIANHDIDWSALLEMATDHEVKPLLYKSLSAVCPDAVPQPILRSLQTYFQANAIHNLLLAQKLQQVLDLFEAHDILAIPFKGPILAMSAYGDLALRQFGDLDLLVREQDFLEAKQLLIAQGYQMLKDTEHEQTYLQAQLFHETDKIGVDLHYGIPPKALKINSSEWWTRLEPVSLLGKSVLALAPLDCLLVVCVNASKENWASLNKLCDIAELIRSYPDLPWSNLMRQTSIQSIERPIYSSLLFASRLLGKPTKGFLIRKFLYWSIACLTIAPTVKDRWLLPLPQFLQGLYYVIRPIRLTGALFLAFWQILIKTPD